MKGGLIDRLWNSISGKIQAYALDSEHGTNMVYPENKFSPGSGNKKEKVKEEQKGGNRQE